MKKRSNVWKGAEVEVKEESIKGEEKTEKIVETKELKWYRMTAMNGMSFRFEVDAYQAAQEWSRKQLETLGLVYPKDIATLAEEK